MQITIGQLKTTLMLLDPNRVLLHCFYDEHSYRGMYDCLSVCPTHTYITVPQKISCLHYATQGTYTGWKGGEYDYYDDTPVFFAQEGCTENGAGYHEYTSLTPIRRYFLDLIGMQDILLCEQILRNHSV
jgi:hypothetical protein